MRATGTSDLVATAAGRSVTASLYSEPMKLVRVKASVSDEQAVKAMRDTQGDEIMFTDGKDRYVLQALGLNVSGRIGLPKAGEKIVAGGIEGTVLASDDDFTPGVAQLLIGVSVVAVASGVVAMALSGVAALSVLTSHAAVTATGSAGSVFAQGLAGAFYGSFPGFFGVDMLKPGTEPTALSQVTDAL